MTPPAIPQLRLAGFYFAYYAALGAFTPYWGLYLQSKGLQPAAISVLMSLWYATRIFAPSTWTTLAAHSPRPVRWLWIGSALTVLSFAGFFLPLDFAGLFAAMCLFCFFCNAVMPQFESITQSHLGQRNHLYGRIRVWGSIGFIVVVAGYGWLIDRMGIATLPWLMMPLFVAVLGFAFANDYAHLPEETDHSLDGGFRARLKRPAVIAFFAAVMQLLARFFPGRMNGHGQGLFYGLSSGVGGVAGALLAGQLWRFGGQTAFAVCGFIALAGSVIAWRWLVKPEMAVGAT